MTVFCDDGARHDTARSNLNRLLAATGSGDSIKVDRIERIADSVSDFYELLVCLKTRGVGSEVLEDAFIFKPGLESEAHAGMQLNP